jgi:hypothetical protein
MRCGISPDRLGGGTNKSPLVKKKILDSASKAFTILSAKEKRRGDLDSLRRFTGTSDSLKSIDV